MAPKSKRNEDEIDTVVSAPPRAAAPSPDGIPTLTGPEEDDATAAAAPPREAAPNTDDDEKTA